MNFACIARLTATLRLQLAAPELPAVLPEMCPPTMAGDLTINCFRLAKPAKRPPMELAALVVTLLQADPDVAAATAVKAFVNVTLRPAALFRDTLDATVAPAPAASGRLPAAQQRRYLVEYSAPNTNKPQHLGHVRNNTLGAAVCGILGHVGHTVAPVNLVNDRGIHICKSMLAYQRVGAGATPASAGKKGDHLVGDFYVKFDQLLQAQLKELRAANPALAETPNEELFAQTEIGQAAQALLVAWENGDPAVRALWSLMNAWVLDGFAQTYRRMGITFTRTYYESETYGAGRDLVLAALEKGIFQRRADGAVEIDLSAQKLGKKVVLRADGTTVYVTQDIATTMRKYDHFKPDGMIWVVGDEQKFHFEVLFAILRAFGVSWAGDLHHLAYGMVNLPSGRMKSREGTVVDADNLFDELEALSYAEIAKRSEGTAEAEIKARAQVIAMGAVKFMLLKVSPKTTMIFNPEESVRFEGDTGPYVQYACARIASIVRKAADDEGSTAAASADDLAALGEPLERRVALLTATYPVVLQTAAADLDPSGLAGFLLDLAKEYHRFYHEHPVLKAPTPALRRARLALSARVLATLQDGLATLGIGTLQAM